MPCTTATTAHGGVQGLTRQAMTEFLQQRLGEEHLAAILKQLPAVEVPQDVHVDMDQVSALRIGMVAAQACGLEFNAMILEFGKFFLPWSMQVAGHRQQDVQHAIHQVSDTFVGFASCLNQVLVSLYSTLGSGRPGVSEAHLSKITHSSFQLGLFVADESKVPFIAAVLHLFQGLLLWAAENLFQVDVHFSGLEVSTLSSGLLLQSCNVTYTPRGMITESISPDPKQRASTAPCLKVVHGLDPGSFHELFPFHFILDMQLCVVQSGAALARTLPAMAQQGASIRDVMAMSMPRVPWSMDCLDVVLGNSKTKVVLSSLSSTLELTGGLHRVRLAQRAGSGQLIEGGEALVFLGSPVLSNAEVLRELKLFLSDIPAHDPTGGAMMEAAFREGRAAEALQQAQQDNEALKQTLAEALASHQEEAGVPSLQVQSPGYLVLQVLEGLLLGEDVGAKAVLQAREALLKSVSSVWKPLEVDWSAVGADKEVNQSLARLLGSDGYGGCSEASGGASDWRLPALELTGRTASQLDANACGQGSEHSSGEGGHVNGRRMSEERRLLSTDPDLWQNTQGGAAADLPQGSYSTASVGPSGQRQLLHTRSLGLAAYRRYAHASSRRLTSRSLDTPSPHAQSPRGAAHALSEGTRARSPGAPDENVPTTNTIATSVRIAAATTACAATPASSPDNGSTPLQDSLDAKPSSHKGSWLKSMMEAFKSGKPEQGPVPLGRASQSSSQPCTSEAASAEPSTHTTTIPQTRTLHEVQSVASQALQEQLPSFDLHDDYGSHCQHCGAQVPKWAPVVKSEGARLAQSLELRHPGSAAGALVPPKAHDTRASSLDMTHTHKHAGAAMGPKLTAPAAQIHSTSQGSGCMRASLPVQLVLMPPGDKVSALLQGVHEWQFDTFALDEATGGRPLSFLAFHLITRAGMVKQLGLNETRLARFLMHIEDGYGDNPYHCRTHAADVLRSLHVVLHRGGVLKAIAKHTTGATSVQSLGDDEHVVESARLQQLLKCYLAAIVHDYEHRGVNNDFLVKSSDPLALLYNDMSPLEMHHASAALTLMQQPQFAFMPLATVQARTVLRRGVIDLVLATDMKQHFALNGSFSLKLLPSSERHKSSKRKGPATGPDTSADTYYSSGSPCQLSSGPLVEPWDDDTEMLVLKMALKAADLGHLTSSIEVHKKWVARLEQELFLQGDRERALGQPISPLMDRFKTGIQKSQCGFFSVVAQPMYENFAKALPDCQPLVANLVSNLLHWREVEAAGHLST